MFLVTRKVSFSVVVALTLSWGLFFLLFLKSSLTLLQAETLPSGTAAVLTSGVRLNLQVDKRVYRGGETVMVSLRNDSRAAIWLPARSDACQPWWKVEQLATDGETWQSVTTSKTSCQPVDRPLERFTTHTVKTGEWPALVPSASPGNVMINPPTGTYRMAVVFLKGRQARPSDWAGESPGKIVSVPFTIQ